MKGIIIIGLIAIVFIVVISVTVNAAVVEVWSAVVQTGGGSMLNSSNVPNESNRVWVQNSSINGSGNQISLLVSNILSNNRTDMDGLSICEKNATIQACTPGTLKRVTMNGSNNWTVAPLGYNWTDWIDFTIDPEKDYYITTYHILFSWMDYYSGTSTQEYVWKTIPDYSQLEDWQSGGDAKNYLFGGVIKMRVQNVSAEPPLSINYTTFSIHDQATLEVNGNAKWIIH